MAPLFVDGVSCLILSDLGFAGEVAALGAGDPKEVEGDP